jgi:hypothetical protein
MEKYLKEFSALPLKFRTLRLVLAGVSVCLVGLTLGAYARAAYLGMWFTMALNGVAVLLNVYALLVNLGIARPWPKPQVRVEINIMQVYPPLAADHPLVTDEKEHCCLCEQRFKEGDTTTLVNKERPEVGKTVAAFPAHAGCVQLAMTQIKPS